MSALTLLDSRSFRNKLDYFVSVAARKRPKPSDEELAEALQPVLDAYNGSGPGPGLFPFSSVQALQIQGVKPKPVIPVIDEDTPPAPQKERSIIEKMDDWIAEYAPKVAACPMQPNGIRYVPFDQSIPPAEFTGYTNDKTDAPFFVDPSEMTMMEPSTGAWLFPCRMR